jgi:PilZ domain
MKLARAAYNRRPPSPVVLRTRVVRCTPNGLGVQFLLEKEAERQTLANFLKNIPA